MRIMQNKGKKTWQILSSEGNKDVGSNIKHSREREEILCIIQTQNKTKQKNLPRFDCSHSSNVVSKRVCVCVCVYLCYRERKRSSWESRDDKNDNFWCFGSEIMLTNKLIFFSQTERAEEEGREAWMHFYTNILCLARVNGRHLAKRWFTFASNRETLWPRKWVNHLTK